MKTSKTRKPDTVESLRKELKETRRLAACRERDYRDMLRGRDQQIGDLKHHVVQLQHELANAGKHFDRLRSSLSLIGHVTEEAHNLAGHFAGAYQPAQAQTPFGR